MAKSLEEKLAKAQDRFRKAFTPAEKREVARLKTLHWFDYTDEDKLLLRNWGSHYKKVRGLQRQLGKQKSWENKLKNAPDKLQKLKDRVNSASKLFCMDLEMYEHNGELTEVGVAVWENNQLKTYHLVVEETYNLRNGINVPDHKDDFLFGTTEVLPLEEVERRTLELVQDADYIVGHSFKNDKAFLAQAGYFKNTTVLDTQSYAPFYHRSNKMYSLKNVVLETLEEEPKCLHNGGNDAYYTLKSLLKMAEVA